MRIRSRIYSQGSFGLYRINPANGRQIGLTMRVWFLYDRTGPLLATSLTRDGVRAIAKHARKEGIR